MFDRLSNKPYTMLWIEPNIKGAQKVHKKIGNFIKGKCAPHFGSTQVNPLEDKYKWFHPFQKRELPCQLLVQEYKKLK